MFGELWRRVESACDAYCTSGVRWTWDEQRQNQKWISSSHVMSLKRAWDFVTGMPNNPIQNVRDQGLKMQPTVRRFLEEMDSNEKVEAVSDVDSPGGPTGLMLPPSLGDEFVKWLSTSIANTLLAWSGGGAMGGPRVLALASVSSAVSVAPKGPAIV